MTNLDRFSLCAGMIAALSLAGAAVNVTEVFGTQSEVWQLPQLWTHFDDLRAESEDIDRRNEAMKRIQAARLELFMHLAEGRICLRDGLARMRELDRQRGEEVRPAIVALAGPEEEGLAYRQLIARVRSELKERRLAGVSAIVNRLEAERRQLVPTSAAEHRIH